MFTHRDMMQTISCFGLKIWYLSVFLKHLWFIVSKAFWHSIISIQSKLSSNLFNITSAGINKHKFVERLNLNQDYSCTTVLQIINLDLPIKMILKIQSTPYPIPKFSLVIMYLRFFFFYCCCCFIVWPRC